jgi:hypothetical protein
VYGSINVYSLRAPSLGVFWRKKEAEGWGSGGIAHLFQSDNLLHPRLVLHHLDALLLVQQIEALAPIDLEETGADLQAGRGGGGWGNSR